VHASSLLAAARSPPPRRWWPRRYCRCRWHRGIGQGAHPGCPPTAGGPWAWLVGRGAAGPGAHPRPGRL